MEFSFETTYDAKILTTMAKAVRRILRRRRNIIVHIFAWLFIGFSALTLLLNVLLQLPFDGDCMLLLLVLLMLMAIMLTEDRLNGYLAGKRLLPGTKHSYTTFQEDTCIVRNDAGETRWEYSVITGAAETEAYYLLFYGKNHVSGLEKSSLSGGTDEAFREFLQEKLGCCIRKL